MFSPPFSKSHIRLYIYNAIHTHSIVWIFNYNHPIFSCARVNLQERVHVIYLKVRCNLR